MVRKRKKFQLTLSPQDAYNRQMIIKSTNDGYFYACDKMNEELILSGSFSRSKRTTLLSLLEAKNIYYAQYVEFCKKNNRRAI